MQYGQQFFLRAGRAASVRRKERSKSQVALRGRGVDQFDGALGLSRTRVLVFKSQLTAASSQLHLQMAALLWGGDDGAVEG